MKSANILNIAHSYIKAVKAAGIPVSSAYIFGSHAKGVATKQSDLDICIVSPSFGQDRVKERVLLMKLREGISDLIEPHPLSDIEMTSPFDLFSKQVRETGKRI